MNNLNSVLLEGNLVRDPKQVFAGENGKIMVKFTIASDRYFRKEGGEDGEEVLYIDIQVWGALAEGCLKYLEKGRGVRVVGRLRQEQWNDKDDKAHERIVVVAEHVEFRPTTSRTEQQESR